MTALRTSESTAGRSSRASLSAAVTCAAVVLPCLLVVYLVLRNGGWAFDDNLFLVLAHRQGFTVDWLLSLKFQHWGIAYNALFTVLLHLFPLDYRWALVAMLLVLGASALLLARTVTLLFGTPRVAALIAGWFALSVLFTRALQWFAGGAQALPSTLFDLLCLYAWLRYRRDGSRRWLACSCAALVAGLLFYEKPAFMLLYLLLIRVLLMSDRLDARVLARELWHERLEWGGYALIVLLWLATYLSRHPNLSAGPVTVGEYLTYYRIFWVNTLAPALLGVNIPGAHLDPAQVVFVCAAQLGVLLVVLLSLRVNPAAWRAWLFLALCVFAIGWLVARSRVAQFSVQVANDTRYQFEFAWLVPLAVCFAFARGPLFSPARRAAISRPLGWAAAVVLGCGYALASVASAHRLAEKWPGATARRWEANLEADLARYERGSRRLVVADGVVPFEIISPAFAPLNTLSSLLPVYAPGVHVGGSLDRRVAIVGADGHVRAVTLRRTAGRGPRR